MVQNRTSWEGGILSELHVTVLKILVMKPKHNYLTLTFLISWPYNSISHGGHGTGRLPEINSIKFTKPLQGVNLSY